MTDLRKLCGWLLAVSVLFGAGEALAQSKAAKARPKEAVSETQQMKQKINEWTLGLAGGPAGNLQHPEPALGGPARQLRQRHIWKCGRHDSQFHCESFLEVRLAGCRRNRHPAVFPRALQQRFTDLQ